MLEIKTKDGDTLIMFKGYRGRFNIISCKRGEIAGSNSVIFCKKTNQSETSFEIVGDEPAVGLFLIAYKYSREGLRYRFVSKEIIETSEVDTSCKVNQNI